MVDDHEQHPVKIHRVVPPAAAPLSFADLLHGLSGQLAPRRHLRRLENELKRSFEVRSVYLVSSGTAALYLILEALKSLSPRRDVVIPAYTCFSVPSAIVRAGLRVRLCDVDPETFDFDYDLLARSIDSETLCVVPTHLFGMPADTERVMRLCADRGVFVVEDAAQAMGSRRDGKLLGTMAHAGFFSAGRGKNITCGSGGIVVTRSDEIAGAMAGLYATLPSPTMLQTLGDFIRVLAMTICIRPSLYWLPAGMPCLRLGQTIFDPDFSIHRLSGMKAGLLRRWRRRLEVSNAVRVHSGRLFNAALERGARAPITHLRFPLLMDSRDERDRTYAALRRFGASLMYPTPISDIPPLRGAFDGSRFPAAHRIANTLVTFPTHELVSEPDREVITHHVARRRAGLTV
jgi:dTDP-4-amino-4,6-dideoxygalactose transaminase